MMAGLLPMGRPTHYLTPLLSADAHRWSLVVERTGEPLAVHVETAFDSKARNRGLLGRDGLPPGTALVIAPSNSIHTFFMRFPIDVVYTDRDGLVLKLRRHVKPWRLSGCARAFAVIEMATGAIERVALERGDRLSCRNVNVTSDQTDS